MSAGAEATSHQLRQAALSEIRSLYVMADCVTGFEPYIDYIRRMSAKQHPAWRFYAMDHLESTCDHPEDIDEVLAHTHVYVKNGKHGDKVPDDSEMLLIPTERMVSGCQQFHRATDIIQDAMEIYQERAEHRLTVERLYTTTKLLKWTVENIFPSCVMVKSGRAFYPVMRGKEPNSFVVLGGSFVLICDACYDIDHTKSKVKESRPKYVGIWKEGWDIYFALAKYVDEDELVEKLKNISV